MTAKIKGTRSRRKKAKASLAPDLNADQAWAVAALTAAIHRGDPMCRLLGYAGTGKSFAVVRLPSYVSRRPVLLTAPTNKAAAVLLAMALEIEESVRATTISTKRWGCVQKGTPTRAATA